MITKTDKLLAAAEVLQDKKMIDEMLDECNLGVNVLEGIQENLKFVITDRKQRHELETIKKIQELLKAAGLDTEYNITQKDSAKPSKAKPGTQPNPSTEKFDINYIDESGNVQVIHMSTRGPCGDEKASEFFDFARSLKLKRSDFIVGKKSDEDMHDIALKYLDHLKAKKQEEKKSESVAETIEQQ